MPDKIRSELASLVKQLFTDRVRRRTSRKARSGISVVRMDFQRINVQAFRKYFFICFKMSRKKFGVKNFSQPPASGLRFFIKLIYMFFI